MDARPQEASRGTYKPVGLLLSITTVCVYVCMCICMHACMYISMYSCMYVCTNDTSHIYILLS